MVTTETHLGSDHKGISWHLRGDAPKKASKGGQKGRKPPDKAPHRAYLMEETKVGTATALDTYLASDRIAEFNASPTSGKECFGEWDVVKSKVKNFAQHTWEDHVKKKFCSFCPPV